MRNPWFGKTALAIVSVFLLAGAAVGQPAPLPTDEAVRSGMTQIRATIIEHHTLITHRRLPVAMAQKFSDGIVRQVASIRSGSTLSGDVRAKLDLLLSSIESGARTVGAGGDSLGQMDGLFAITKALDAYGRTFEHPEWQPIQER